MGCAALLHKLQRWNFRRLRDPGEIRVPWDLTLCRRCCTLVSTKSSGTRYREDRATRDGSPSGTGSQLLRHEIPARTTFTEDTRGDMDGH